MRTAHVLLMVAALLTGACKKGAKKPAADASPAAVAPGATPGAQPVAIKKLKGAMGAEPEAAAPEPGAPEPVGAEPAAPEGGDAEAIETKVSDLIGKGGTSDKSYEVALADGKQQVAFTSVDAVRLIISASCLKDGKLACDAWDAVKTISGKQVKTGPGAPAAYYCEPAGGEAVKGSNPDGEAGLCRFSDGSMVSDWSFIYTPRMALGK